MHKILVRLIEFELEMHRNMQFSKLVNTCSKHIQFFNII